MNKYLHLHVEHKKLQRTVRTLLLKITANRKTPANDSSLVIKLYEQHFRARKKPQLRPMKCDGFFYDQRGNLAIMGEQSVKQSYFTDVMFITIQFLDEYNMYAVILELYMIHCTSHELARQDES